MNAHERVDRNDVVVCEPQTELWRMGRSTRLQHLSRLDSEIAEDDRAGNRFDVLGGGVLCAASNPHRGLRRDFAGIPAHHHPRSRPGSPAPI